MWYFYVARSGKDLEWFYKGSTENLRVRMKQHNDGRVDSTRPYVPLELVYYEAYLTQEAARERESAVKKSGSVWMPLRKRIRRMLGN